MEAKPTFCPVGGNRQRCGVREDRRWSPSTENAGEVRAFPQPPPGEQRPQSSRAQCARRRFGRRRAGRRGIDRHTELGGWPVIRVAGQISPGPQWISVVKVKVDGDLPGVVRARLAGIARNQVGANALRYSVESFRPRAIAGADGEIVGTALKPDKVGIESQHARVRLVPARGSGTEAAAGERDPVSVG